MRFNVCIGLSKKEIKNSLLNEDDLVILLLYQEKDELIKKMLVNESDFLNSATGDISFFTFIDTQVLKMEPESKTYGGNDFNNIPNSRSIYNKMLFIGSTFGVGNNYPAVIVYSPQSGEYVAIKIPTKVFNKERGGYWFLVNNIINEVNSTKKQPLFNMFKGLNHLKIGSNYNFDNFDIVDKIDTPQKTLADLLSKYGYDNKYIAHKMAMLSELNDDNEEKRKKLEQKYYSNLSQWTKENTDRKPSSMEIRLICGAIGATYDEYNLLLIAFDYAPLNPQSRKDREIIEDIKKNNIEKANTTID